MFQLPVWPVLWVAVSHAAVRLCPRRNVTARWRDSPGGAAIAGPEAECSLWLSVPRSAAVPEGRDWRLARACSPAGCTCERCFPGLGVETCSASLHVDPSLTSHQCHASLPARGWPWHCLAAVELFTDWPSGLKGSAPSHCVLSLPSLSSPSMEFCFLNRTRPRERRMSLCEQAIDCQGFSRPAGKEGTQVSLHL